MRNSQSPITNHIASCIAAVVSIIVHNSLYIADVDLRLYEHFSALEVLPHASLICRYMGHPNNKFAPSPSQTNTIFVTSLIKMRLKNKHWIFWYRRLLRGKGKPSPWLVLLELITLLSQAYQPVITGSLHKRSIGWKERPKDCLTTRVLSCDLTSRDSNSHVKHPARADRLSCELSCAWIFSHTTRIGQGAYRQVCSRARPLWSPCILAFVVPHFANY